MNNFIKLLSSSQRFQDFAGVARGTYKVLAGVNPNEIISPLQYNEIHKNRNVNLKDQNNEIKSDNMKKNINTDKDDKTDIKMTEQINKTSNTKSSDVETIISKNKMNLNKSTHNILDHQTKNNLESQFLNKNNTNESPLDIKQNIEKVEERDRNFNSQISASDLNKNENINFSQINQDISVDDKHKKAENADLVNYKSKPGSSNIDLVAKEQLKEKKIPATALSRALSFGQLGLSVLGGGVAEAIKQNLGISQKTEGSGFKKYLLTENTAEKISDALCKMRGAPLKLGQILSIQEDALIPKPLRQAFEKARKTANVMPLSQVNGMLNQELGNDWNKKFKSFDSKPFAAASIGQVHMGVTNDGHPVAIKIQYPGVRESVDSDLENLKRIMEWSNVFPKTMFLEELIKYTRKELMEECDYDAEREKQEKYRNCLAHRKDVYVPKTFPSLSTSRILTAELINGVTLDFAAENLSQSKRNKIGKRVMSLTLEELFKFNYMQTDPNPANYFYDVENDQLFLLDFGATRAFPDEFLDNYIEIIKAATEKKTDRITDLSKVIGFLTGEENRTMLNAHENSIMTVGEPFAYKGEFDFGSQTMTEKIYKLMPVMFKNRLKAPPPEVYSLHRKLSGAFLINMKLRTKINCQDMFEELYYEFRKRNKIVKTIS